MRRVAVTFFTVVFLACQAPTPSTKAPSGPAGDMARQIATITTAGADLVDQPFEDFLAKLDPAKAFGANANAIVDQIRKSRTGANQATASLRASGGARLASVMRSIGTFSVPQFANNFAFSLDELTKKNQTIAAPARPYGGMVIDDFYTTTTTLNVTEIYSGSGAHVTGTVRWSYSTITIATGGATVFHMTDDRELVGGIDVCPDANGGVPATLEVTSSIVSETAGVTTSRKSTGKSTFQGKVNDQAALVAVTQQQRVETSWSATSGSGGYSSNTSSTWNAGANGFLSTFDSSAFSGSVTPNGGASVTDAARGAGWDIALDAFAIEPAYKSAQELWRRGRCVVVSAYGAETPINTQDQDKSQHDEAVDPASETKFDVGLKHRFSGAVSAPITASLSGTKTLEPNRLESSGSLTYKAPDEDDRRATATLRSTSRRGIGTLVLDFHTGGALTLTIAGEVRGDSSYLGTVRTLDTVKIGPLEFKKWTGDIWQATGTWTAQTSSFTAVGLGSDTCEGSDSGTITLMATIETRGGKKVWVIDPADATSEGKGSNTCQSSLGDQTLRGATIPGRRTYDTDGEAAELFMGNLEPFTIPAEGGTVRVHGTSGGASGSFTSDGTATAKR